MNTQRGYKNWNLAQTLLIAIVLAVLTGVGTAYLVTAIPVVNYSVKTGKPVSVETDGKEIKVTPSTKIPVNHEKNWVP
jgi:hypothetical protein